VPTVIKSPSAPFEARDTEESPAWRTKRGLLVTPPVEDGDVEDGDVDGPVVVLEEIEDDGAVDEVGAGVAEGAVDVAEGAVAVGVASVRRRLRATGAPAPPLELGFVEEAGTKVVSIGCSEPSAAL